jgi:hypothetical protein
MTLSTICVLFLLRADLIKAPQRIPTDSGSVIVSTKAGPRRWTAKWTMEPFERDGKKGVRFTEQGQGHVSPFSGDVRWSLEALWSAENGLQPLQTEKTVTSSTGAPLATERKQFDHTKGTVRFERRSSDGRSEVKSVPTPPDTLAVEGIAGILRFLAFDRTAPFPAHMLSNEPRLYSVTFESRGKERVRTPAGEFDAYKVEMVPHVGLLNVFRSFVPKAFFWFTVAPPHFWVRYEGPENGPGTPEIVMELAR